MRTARFAAAISGIAAIVMTACSMPTLKPGVPRGAALLVAADGGSGTKNLWPGMEVLAADSSFINESDEDITVRSVTLEGLSGFGRVAKLVRIQLGPQSRDAPSGTYPNVGFYETYPPVMYERDKTNRDDTIRGCIVQPVTQVEGFTLRPGDEALIVIWVRVIGEGEWRIARQRILYEQGGRLYQQAATWVQEGKSKVDNPRGRVLERKDWGRCIDHAKFLPGWCFDVPKRLRDHCMESSDDLPEMRSS